MQRWRAGALIARTRDYGGGRALRSNSAKKSCVHHRPGSCPRHARPSPSAGRSPRQCGAVNIHRCCRPLKNLGSHQRPAHQQRRTCNLTATASPPSPTQDAFRLVKQVNSYYLEKVPRLRPGPIDPGCRARAGTAPAPFPPAGAGVALPGARPSPKPWPEHATRPGST